MEMGRARAESQVCFFIYIKLFFFTILTNIYIWINKDYGIVAGEVDGDKKGSRCVASRLEPL